jgi:tetratricopeptide (TPR) repeat protein
MRPFCTYYQGGIEKAEKAKKYRAQTKDIIKRRRDKSQFIYPASHHNFEAIIRILKADEDAMFRRPAASELLTVFAPVRFTGQFNHLFHRRKATKALKEAMRNDEDPSVQEIARNVLVFVRNKPNWKAMFEASLPNGSQVVRKPAQEESTLTNDAEMWLAKGLGHHHGGQLNEAIDAYRQAINLRPDFTYGFVVHFNLGIAYETQEMVDEAIAEYKRTIALKPEYAPAHQNLGVAFSRKGLYNEAIAELRLASYIHGYSTPGKAEAHYNLGLVYVHKEMLEEAVVELKRATELKPDFDFAYYTLACVYSENNDTAQAVESLEKAIGFDDEYIQTAKKDMAFDNILGV